MAAMAAIPKTVGEALCLDFVNSRYSVHRTGAIRDRLPTPEWQRWFLERGGFNLATEEVPVAELAEARGDLRALLERWAATGSLDEAGRAALDRMLGAAPGTRRLAPGRGVEFAPRRPDWRWVVAEVAASASELVTSGDPTRLKVCGNADCTWLFYDQSYNASRRWCDVATCGNLVKVREFRARRRAQV